MQTFEAMTLVYCCDLTEVMPGSPVQTSEDYVFFQCTAFAEVTLGSSVQMFG